MAEFLGAGAAVLVVLVIPIVAHAQHALRRLDEHGRRTAPKRAREHAEPKTRSTRVDDAAAPGHDASRRTKAKTDVRTDAAGMAERRPPTRPPSQGLARASTATPTRSIEGEVMNAQDVVAEQELLLRPPRPTRSSGWPRALRSCGSRAIQDKSKDLAITSASRASRRPASSLIAFSLTFAVFDWIMSLDPTWYSTIFGVTYLRRLDGVQLRGPHPHFPSMRNERRCSRRK